MVDGTHPGTGQPYRWTDDVRPTADSLTPITGDDIERFLDHVVHGYLVTVGATITEASALKYIPCGELGYDEWIAHSAAIKAALGGDEAHYHVFKNWCLEYSDNTIEVIRQKWDSIRDAEIGADFLYRRAAGNSWTGW